MRGGFNDFRQLCFFEVKRSIGFYSERQQGTLE